MRGRMVLIIQTVFLLLVAIIGTCGGIGAILFILFLASAYMVKLNFSTNFMQSLAFLLSFIALGLSVFFTVNSNSNKHYDDLKNENYRKKEEERRNKEIEIHKIRDSIDLFYIPLLNLLETNDAKLITTVNGHKYLAEPRVRYLFEIYLETNKGEEKLLELAHRDVELLQVQLG
ncbi:MAG TPA: hypothetical protein VGK06_15480 [Methanosarcina sp.]|jgi:hypothetical protein